MKHNHFLFINESLNIEISIIFVINISLILDILNVYL